MSDQLEKRGRALENEYFRRKEEELIAKMKEKLASEETKQLELPCPKDCDGKLVEADYENIVIDICNECQGVWLDAGELAQIVDQEEKGWLKGFFS